MRSQVQTFNCGTGRRSITAAASVDSETHVRSISVTTWSGARVQFEEAFNAHFDCRSLGDEIIVWTSFHLLHVDRNGLPTIAYQTDEPIVTVYPLNDSLLLVCEVSVQITTKSGAAEVGLFDVVLNSDFEFPVLRLDLFDGQSIAFRVSTDPPGFETIAIERVSGDKSAGYR